MLNKLNEVSLVDAEMLQELGSKQADEEFTYTFKNLTFDKRLEDGKFKLFIQSNGGPKDKYKSLLMQHIYITRKWKHRHYNPVWDYRQKSQNVSMHEKSQISEEDIVEPMTYENLDESLENLNSSEDGQLMLLNEIIRKLQKNCKTSKWKNVTPRELYVDKLDTANSTSKNSINKEMDIIAELLSSHTNVMSLFTLNLVLNSTQFEPIATRYVSNSTHRNTSSVPAEVQGNSFIS